MVKRREEEKLEEEERQRKEEMFLEEERIREEARIKEEKAARRQQELEEEEKARRLEEMAAEEHCQPVHAPFPPLHEINDVDYTAKVQVKLTVYLNYWCYWHMFVWGRLEFAIPFLKMLSFHLIIVDDSLNRSKISYNCCIDADYRPQYVSETIHHIHIQYTSYFSYVLTVFWIRS